ncbi:MAG: ompP1 [Gammaproteobacteria bacterium]|jgi:long-chain fatty acid transport protein|nr:ompP1 [Gammaproteobacteria bacterium]
MKHPFFRLSLIALLASASTGAFAAAFMLNEQNAVQTGDFGAGGAAIAEDASTAWFNPAGLTRIDKPQIVAGGNGINFSSKFTGQVSQQVDILGTTISGGTQNVNGISGGAAAFIPFFHAAYPINPNIVAGFSVTTPFGLETNYSPATYVRYAATETKLSTIDISPSLGVKLNNKFSLGLGVDEQRLLATFDSYAALDPIDNPSTQTLSHNVASDWAPGWHIGGLFEPTNTTRIGLSYHSKVVHHATGYSLFSGGLASPDFLDPTAEYYSGNASTTLTLPANTTLSAYHDMNNRWAVMGSIIYTQWSVLNQLVLNNVAAIDPNLDTQGLVTAVVPQNFHNTWRASVGTTYKIAPQWLVRTGVGYDETPTNNTDRNLRLPDGDRYAVAFGARYLATKNTTLDAGWTHEFVKTVNIDNTTTVSTQQTYVNGHSYSNANIFGLQLTYSFA